MSVGDATKISATPRAEDAFDLLARGDRKGAIELLMNEHGDAILGFCVRMLGDRSMADDVLQQTFLGAYRDLDTVQQRSSVRSWLFGIASHRCHDALKSRRRRELRIRPDDTGMTDVVDPAAGPRDKLDKARLAAALEDCLRVLSEEARMVVLLRFQADMSYERMSASMDTKADTLQRRVSRALPGLRKCLEEKGWTGE